MKPLKRTLMIVAVAALSFACAKPGCTDQNATNYNSSAKKDDGSCKYPDAKLSFYTSQGTYYDFAIFVNSNYVGELTQYFPSGKPICAQSGTLTATLNVGANTIYARARNGNGDLIYWETTVTVPANQYYCETFLLY